MCSVVDVCRTVRSLYCQITWDDGCRNAEKFPERKTGSLAKTI